MKSIILGCGVPAVIDKFKARHQRILTEDEGKNFEENIFEVLKELTVSIEGMDKEELTEEFFRKEILDPDRKQLLAEMRNYALKNAPDFNFTYKYEYNNKKFEQSVEVDLRYTEIITNPDGTKEEVERIGFKVKPTLKQYTSYKDVLKDKYQYFTLPESGMKMRFRMLDGRAGGIAKTIKKKDRSTHTPLVMRNLCYSAKEDKDGNHVWTEMDLAKIDDLDLIDIEFIRTKIKEIEGRLDSEVMFTTEESREKVVVEAVGLVAFFFPSEAI